MKKRILSMVLALTLVLGCFSGVTVRAAERNLALNQPTEASSVANNCGPELAVDGNTEPPQWNSVDMKSGTVSDDADQNEQWLQVDLGTSGAVISQIKLWYNLKVWPMVYRIETTDTPADAASWKTVVAVSRPSRNGWVWNGDGQNIADETANTDTITTTSNPRLETTELCRYVRFYVEKINAQAPGNNVNLREIEIFGTMPGGEEPTYTVRGSVLENVISNDGTPSRWNIGQRDVTLLVNENGVEKNIVVTAEDQSANYPAEWFPQVDAPNPKPQVIPTIQEWYGYEGSFTLTEDSSIVINDKAGVDLQKAAAVMQENLTEITGLTLPIIEGTTGGADDIYIEAITDSELYDLGEEGYLMVTNDRGIQIFAPTYTGCVFGTVTVEQILWMAADHASVPMGIIRDYPAYEVRGLKLDIARTPYRYQQLQDYAKIMRWYKMNEYDLHINDNDNANISTATMESHAGFHRLESETFPSLMSETKHVGFPQSALNADYYNNNPDYQGNPMYTKQQWRDLAQMTEELGMYMVTEIDLPAHSLLYNKYAIENPDNIDWLTGGIHNTGNELWNSNGEIELMDLTGANKDRALEFSRALWDEYTRGDEPAIFGGNNPMLGEPNLLGAKAVIWGDQSQEGMTERDIHQRVLQAIAIVSEKTWNGTDEDDTFTEWEIRFGHLAEGPGTEIAMNIESASSLVLKYQFDQVSADGTTVFDLSGNGYDAAVTGGSFADGWMRFDGESLLETPLKTLSYPYTVSFDVKLSAEDVNTAESSIFSGYDGRIQIAGDQGRLSADVNYFTRDFGYRIPTDGTAVEVTIVGTFQGTKVYVDGELVSFLSQKTDGDGLEGAVTSLYSSVLLPLQKIGQDFSGSLADIRVYNKAFSAEEVRDAYDGIDDGKVNVAQDTYSGSDSYKTGDAQDDGEQRTRTSAKAIDGDAFVIKADKAAQPDTATSDIYSYWRGDHADSALTIDLGQTREISEIGIQWRYGGKGRDMDILTSLDGEAWTTAKSVRGNGDFFQTITLDSPVTARYVKLQGIASNASVYMIQEFLVYEAVDKTELAALLADAMDRTSEEVRQAMVFAQAMLENPLATTKEVAEAAAKLKSALEAHEHSYEAVVTAPTCTEPGFTTYTCACGDSYVADETEALGHDWKGTTCTRCDAKRENPFTDVPEDSFYIDPVLWAVEEGITTGATPTTFNPKGDLLRAQFVTFLWRAAGEPEPTTTVNPFTDVKESDFYYKAVLWAVEEGITTGSTATTFNPMGVTNRAQAVTFLWRYLDQPTSTASNSFTDVVAGMWYEAPINWAVENGVTNGMGDGTFGISNPCNRAHAVTFMYRALAKVMQK